MSSSQWEGKGMIWGLVVHGGGQLSPAVAGCRRRWLRRLTTLCGVWFMLILPASMSGLVPLHFFSCPLPTSSWKTEISAEGASPFISLWLLFVPSATTANSTSSSSSCALQNSPCFSTAHASASSCAPHKSPCFRTAQASASSCALHKSPCLGTVQDSAHHDHGR